MRCPPFSISAPTMNVLANVSVNVYSVLTVSSDTDTGNLIITMRCLRATDSISLSQVDRAKKIWALQHVVRHKEVRKEGRKETRLLVVVWFGRLAAGPFLYVAVNMGR